MKYLYFTDSGGIWQDGIEWRQGFASSINSQLDRSRINSKPSKEKQTALAYTKTNSQKERGKKKIKWIVFAVIR